MYFLKQGLAHIIILFSFSSSSSFSSAGPSTIRRELELMELAYFTAASSQVCRDSISINKIW